MPRRGPARGRPEAKGRETTPTGKRRSRLQPDARREHLVRTAVTVFARDGVGASVVRITREAGVSNGTFYHYFSNRQELEKAVAALVGEDLIRDLLELQESLSYAQRVAVGAVAVMHEVATNQELGSILAEYFERSNEVARQTAVQLEQDIRKGGEAGEFPIASPTEQLVGIFIATFGVGARAVLAGADPGDLGEFVAAAHLRMLGVRPERADAIASWARSRTHDWHAERRRRTVDSA